MGGESTTQAAHPISWRQDISETEHLVMPIESKPRILIFAASNRADSYHRRLARAAVESLTAAGAEVTLADLRDYPLPLYDGDLETAQGLPERAKTFKELLRSHDGVVIASPEYNGSFSALLKNTIDWIS